VEGGAPPNHLFKFLGYEMITIAPKVPFGVDNVGGVCHTCITSKRLGQISWLARQQKMRKQMANAIEIGQAFTTAKSGVSGIVQEIVKNANGSYRVRLDVAGQPRWTTVK